MARRAKIYKTKTEKKKTEVNATAPSLSIPKIKTGECANTITFKQRYYEEDLLDRL